MHHYPSLNELGHLVGFHCKYNGSSPYKLKKYVNKGQRQLKLYTNIYDKYMGFLNSLRS